MTDIIYVNENDEVIGSGPRDEALQKGIAHRIVRLFLVNSNGELLIQKRADDSKSLPGRWDQSAAGHVDEGESYVEAAIRETEEEIGLKNLPLKEVCKFYTEETDDKMLLKRFNTLYSANYDGEINFGEREISEVRWIDMVELKGWMKEKPQDFTQGFMKSFEQYMKKRSL